MASGNRLRNLPTGEGEEKEEKRRLTVLTWERFSRFCFRVPHFHDKQRISSYASFIPC